MDNSTKFSDLNPVSYTLKQEKRKVKLSIIGLLIYAAALTLGFMWFDWKLIVFVFLFAWANNLGILVSSIMPIEKTIALMNMKEKTQEEIDKIKNQRR